MPRGQAEDAKRALVAILKSLGRTYGVPVQLTRASTDAAVRGAYRRVFLRAHPDTGGKRRTPANAPTPVGRAKGGEAVRPRASKSQHCRY